MGQQLTRYQRYYQSLSPEKKEAYLKRKAEYREAHREKMAAYRRAYRKARRHGEEPPKEGKRKYTRIAPAHYRIYALYKGDEFIDIGDKFYLAREYGLTTDYIGWSATPTGKRRFYERGATGYTTVKLDDPDEEGGDDG